MSEKDFPYLKEMLDKETYGDISYSENEKRNVLMSISPAKKKAKRPFVKKLVLYAATVLVFAGGGAFIYSEIDQTPGAAGESHTMVKADKESTPSAADDAVAASDAAVDEKAWEDRTNKEGLTELDSQNVQEFIAELDEIYKNGAPEHFSDDPALYYWIGGSQISYFLDKHYKAEGIAIEKDLKNLRDAAAIVYEEHQNRYAHLGLENENPFKYKDQFKEPSERLFQAHTYVRKLLNDLNIALNGAAGESEGVAYMLDGERTNELESFIKNE
ncbi:hypothetical protein LCM00_23600 [Bacillus infantis]|uniref:hypothetical protein n=1 Tax=Bacillus infantis TaxID=324767 RepID=UPI001CD43980|nr:hypothetical protein [Bacillus infantis]MCA1042478.1 hypothetical protein [Bacillus infantis]